MLKRALLLIPTFLVLFFIIFISAIFIHERFLINRYKETKLNVSVDYLKNVWGEPNRNLINKAYAGNRVLIYQTGFTEFAFTFDKNNLLVQKYIGD